VRSGIIMRVFVLVVILATTILGNFQPTPPSPSFKPGESDQLADVVTTPWATGPEPQSEVQVASQPAPITASSPQPVRATEPQAASGAAPDLTFSQDVDLGDGQRAARARTKTQRGLGARQVRMMPTIATPATKPSASVGSATRDANQMPMSQASVKGMRGAAMRQFYHHSALKSKSGSL
jgi:hypothetical protein